MGFGNVYPLFTHSIRGFSVFFGEHQETFRWAAPGLRGTASVTPEGTRSDLAGLCASAPAASCQGNKSQCGLPEPPALRGGRKMVGA